LQPIHGKAESGSVTDQGPEDIELNEGEKLVNSGRTEQVGLVGSTFILLHQLEDPSWSKVVEARIRSSRWH